MPRSASGRRNRWVEEDVGAGATYEVDVALCGVRAKARVSLDPPFGERVRLVASTKKAF